MILLICGPEAAGAAPAAAGAARARAGSEDAARMALPACIIWRRVKTPGRWPCFTIPSYEVCTIETLPSRPRHLHAQQASRNLILGHHRKGGTHGPYAAVNRVHRGRAVDPALSHAGAIRPLPDNPGAVGAGGPGRALESLATATAPTNKSRQMGRSWQFLAVVGVIVGVGAYFYFTSGFYA